MGNDFLSYLERLELMAFFAAYPLLYTLIHVIAGTKSLKSNYLSKLVVLLPFAYALCGTLYLGLQLRNLWPDLSFGSISSHFSSWLKFWGLLALLFWIPVLSRKPLLSLLHSLVIFFFLLKDLYRHATSHTSKEIVQNDMKIFTDSLILNTVSLLTVILLYLLYCFLVKKRKTTG